MKEISDIENYQDAGQSPGVAMEEGQRPDHITKADDRQSSRAVCDQMVVDGLPLGQSSHRSLNHWSSQQD